MRTLVIKVAEEGLRAESGYKQAAWLTVSAEVLKVAGNQPVAVYHCKTKHDAVKRDYRAWVELNKLSGYTFSESGVVIADLDSLRAYFDAHKEARKFKTKPLDMIPLHE